MRTIGFGCFALVISILDIRSFRIPDILLIFLAIFLLISDFLANNFPVSGVFAGALAFTLFFVVYVTTHGLGFGDVKYAGLIGYFLGPQLLIPGFLLASCSALLVWITGFVFFKWNRETKIPFGPFMSIGAFMANINPCGQNNFFSWMSTK
jgi:prepilin signal peptidase PulO-like enzyme (type II secretory pathway)